MTADLGNIQIMRDNHAEALEVVRTIRAVLESGMNSVGRDSLLSKLDKLLGDCIAPAFVFQGKPGEAVFVHDR